MCASIFSRVIAGADGTEPGFEAVRQAARLVDPGGWLEVLTAVHLMEGTLAGWPESRIAEALEAEGGATVRKAVEIAGGQADSRLVNSTPLPALLREVEDQRATLAVVGTHGHSRLSEIVIGGVAGELLHRASCSVLIARPPAHDGRFPRAIAVGVDGSAEAEAARAAATLLALRFDADVKIVEATDEDPVAALVAAAADADLLVVGSRGLTGVRALGSVSERVAHRAPASVLVVR